MGGAQRPGVRRLDGRPGLTRLHNVTFGAHAVPNTPCQATLLPPSQLDFCPF
jgi:hypothetical protein